MAIIYGVDTEKEVTPMLVRDAVVSCFCLAHASQSELGDANSETVKQYCVQIVRRAFEETQGAFDQPTKASLLATLPWLAEFSKSLRDPVVIQKHMGEIQQLIDHMN